MLSKVLGLLRENLEMLLAELELGGARRNGFREKYAHSVIFIRNDFGGAVRGVVV